MDETAFVVEMKLGAGDDGRDLGHRRLSDQIDIYSLYRPARGAADLYEKELRTPKLQRQHHARKMGIALGSRRACDDKIVVEASMHRQVAPARESAAPEYRWLRCQREFISSIGDPRLSLQECSARTVCIDGFPREGAG
jgi:hypothetical protein